VTESVGAYRIEAIQPADTPACQNMTFPAYRHLLAEEEPTFRLPSEPDQWLIRPVALVARTSEQTIGLALAELPERRGEGAPELLSVFVTQPYRGQGIATALVAAMERVLGARGATSVDAVYTTGKPSIAAVERILEKRGWEPPTLRTITVKFTMQEALSTPWYGRFGLLPEGAEIFSWTDLTVPERTQLRESNARAPWIPNSLQPWRHDAHGFDPVSSVGLRYRGEVVGWVINHQIDPRTVRFTCSFMRKDLSRRARIVPLYSEALRRLSETACEVCTLVTPTVYPGMVEFIRRHCAPYASFTGETRGSRKSLPGARD
jgi:GNAT superfamily N-acetyltransferase